MKKFILPALFAVCAVGQAAEDAKLRSNVGVGLGTMLFEAIGYTDTVLGQTPTETPKPKPATKMAAKESKTSSPDSTKIPG